MSIIYDALKKVEKSFEGSPGTAAKQKEQVDASFGVKPHKPPKARKFLIYILAVLFVAAAANSYFTLFAPRLNPAPVPQAKNVPPAPKPLPKQEEPQVVKETEAKPQEIPAFVIPLTRKKIDLSDFTLNGIFFSKDGGYALINNQIVKEGDVIKGVTVKRITADFVELETEGAVAKLTRPR